MIKDLIISTKNHKEKMNEKDLAIAVGNKIKMLRIKNGLDQRSMAEVLKTQFNTVSRIERGLQPVSLHQALEICSYFQCDLSEIIDHAVVNTDKQIEDLKLKVNAYQSTIIKLQDQLLNK